MSPGERRVVGLISDTHGMMRPDVFTALAGVDLILHAGDVGGDEILDELALIAPVHAVYGNTDPPGQPRLSEAIEMEIGGLRVHVSHGHEVGGPTPGQATGPLCRGCHRVRPYAQAADCAGRWALGGESGGRRSAAFRPSAERGADDDREWRGRDRVNRPVILMVAKQPEDLLVRAAGERHQRLERESGECGESNELTPNLTCRDSCGRGHWLVRQGSSSRGLELTLGRSGNVPSVSSKENVRPGSWRYDPSPYEERFAQFAQSATFAFKSLVLFRSPGASRSSARYARIRMTLFRYTTRKCDTGYKKSSPESSTIR